MVKKVSIPHRQCKTFDSFIDGLRGCYRFVSIPHRQCKTIINMKK